MIQVPVTIHVVPLLSELSMFMEPDNPPVQVPAGGKFKFTISVTNNMSEPMTFDGWTMVKLPDQTMFGPLRQETTSISALQTQYYYASQFVPNYAPPGNYEYHAFVGYYPGITLDEAFFPFTILSNSLGEGGANDWTLLGFLTDPFTSPNVVLPAEFSLSQNYPNPFNARSVINYALPAGGNVELAVYNLLGQKVETLVDGYQEAGFKSISWDASQYSSGIYFYQLTAGDKQIVKRMVLVK